MKKGSSWQLGSLVQLADGQTYFTVQFKETAASFNNSDVNSKAAFLYLVWELRYVSLC